jgi:hypothetical protein
MVRIGAATMAAASILPTADVLVGRRAGTQRIPRAYHVTQRQKLGKGLAHLALRRARGADQVVHIARLSSRSDLQIRPVPSRGNASGHGPKLEPTSRLCRRVGCLVAVNGDFFRGGETVGGIVVNGQVVKKPRKHWRQAALDPERMLEAKKLSVQAILMTSELERVKIRSVDPERFRRRRMALYTSAFGRRTPKLHRKTALEFRARKPGGPLRLEQTSVARLQQIRRPRNRVRIPSRGFVVVVRGEHPRWLQRYRRHLDQGSVSRDFLIRLRSHAEAWDSIGGRPLLVRNGRVALPNDRSSFARARHPRTMIGRARDGSLLLVTVDGRQRGRSGMTLREAARFMIRLGAVEALNLDGGGSTAFVTRGRVRNSPSDGRERPVAVALAIVRKSKGGLAAPRAPKLSSMNLPRGDGDVLLLPAQPTKEETPGPILVPLAAEPVIPDGSSQLAMTFMIAAGLVLGRTAIVRRSTRRKLAADHGASSGD